MDYNFEKTTFSEFIDLAIFMRAGESMRLTEVVSFDTPTWLLACIHDDFSGTNKLLLTHNEQSELYPSTVFDIPTPDYLNTWKVWFEHILRTKGLLDSNNNISILDKDLKKLLYVEV